MLQLSYFILTSLYGGYQYYLDNINDGTNTQRGQSGGGEFFSFGEEGSCDIKLKSLLYTTNSLYVSLISIPLSQFNYCLR